LHLKFSGFVLSYVPAAMLQHSD